MVQIVILTLHRGPVRKACSISNRVSPAVLRTSFAPRSLGADACGQECPHYAFAGLSGQAGNPSNVADRSVRITLFWMASTFSAPTERGATVFVTRTFLSAADR